jgi:hypothetical protein
MRVKFRGSNRPIRDVMLRLFGEVGLHVAEGTLREPLHKLVHSLHPYDSGVPLIRVGPDGDGGYLVPDDLGDIGYAFSPGVAKESRFELALAERGMTVLMADRSVDGPAVAHERFQFERKHLGCHSDDDTMTFDAWAERLPPDYSGDLLLQMDVEGAEFEVLMSMSEALLRRFRILVIEFHYLQQLFDKRFFCVVWPVFRKLLTSHSVAHLHPNNCCGSVKRLGLEIPRILEITLLRNDRFRRRDVRTDFPHPLDRDNTRKATLVLPACWYR